MKRVQHIIEYIAYRLFSAMLFLLPRKMSVAFGKKLGSLIYFVGIRRDVSHRNISAALGIEDRALIKAIAIASYQNFVASVVEYATLPLIKGKVASFFECEGEEILEEIIREDKGGILVTGHFGSWEMGGAYIAERWGNIDFLVGKQKNRIIDREMNRIRHIMGIETIPIGVSARGVLKALKRRRLVALLSDQDAGRDGTIVSFFGMKASTPKGPAAFAIKSSAPIFIGFFLRRKDRPEKHIFICKEIIYPKTNKLTDDAINSLTQEYTTVIEDFIREHPDHWFWAHRRWKTTHPELYRTRQRREMSLS